MSKDATTVLRTAGPVRTFDPSIEGVAVITRQGTEVPADKLAAVEKAARSFGARLVRA